MHLSKGKKLSSPLLLFINPSFWQAKNQIKSAPYRKNRKTGSIGLRLNRIKRYSYLLKLVKEYEIEKDTLLFIDHFKIQDIDAFSSYLLHEKCYGVGTVGKQLGLLKTVLIRAKRDGYPVSFNYQFIDFFGLDKQKRILQTLDLEEIELIKKASLHSHLINSWKWMLIGLYTGQRVADLLSLKPDQLRERPKDILYIYFLQQKNGRAVTVGILDP